MIEEAKKRNLKVIMGTPTATIPAWLAKKYPDILSEFEGGKNVPLEEDMCIALTVPQCMRIRKKLFVL